MKLSTMSLLAAAGLAAIAGSVEARPLIINEVYINAKSPDSDGDHEYIEISGPPGMSLDGYAIAFIADTGTGEIDEFFAFGFGDQLSSTDGLLLLCQDDTQYSPSSDAVQIEFDDVSVGGNAGKLQNDGSGTILLLRKYDDETSVDTTVWERDVTIEAGAGSSEIDSDFLPYQCIDEIAYSGDMQQEFTCDDANELDYTPNTQPDALTRYAIEPTGEDSTTFFSGQSEHQKNSYLQWIFGDVDSSREYDSSEAYIGYTTNMSGDLELTAVPSGIALTPGDFNEDENGDDYGHETGASCWDYDFDGDVDCDDRTLIADAVSNGDDLDDTTGSGSTLQYEHQGDYARALLMMTQADETTASTAVQQADLDAFDDANCGLACNDPCSIRGDLNLDGVVSAADLNIAVQGGDMGQIREVLANIGK